MIMKNMNFRNKLLFTIIPLTIIAIGLLSTISYLASSKSILLQQERQMEQLVNKTVNELTVWVEEREREITILSMDKTIREACLGRRLEEAQAKLTAYHKKTPLYEALFIADTNGVILMNSTEQGIGLDVSKIPIYKDNIDKAKRGELWISEVGKSPVSGRPVSLVSTPIMENGKLIGIMGTPVELMVFSDASINSAKIGETGYFFMVDSTGNTLAHPKKENIMKINITDLDFGREMLKLGNGSMSYSYKGLESIATVKTYTKKNWLVCATASKEEFLEDAREIRNISVVLGISSIIVISLAIWFLTGSVFKVIRKTADGLNDAGAQVASASGQVSTSSQVLSEGASEQAASIEETSSSLEEMSSMTRKNADNASEARARMGEAKEVVSKVSEHMDEMAQAIDEITKSSEETGKIIKTIDEIAFQTNLLALNAAVEAARAGEAGSGFAVVADEVRNLAMRAAEAAKNTATLIESTIKAVKHGNELTLSTREAFSENMEIAGKIGELVDEIAEAASEQSQAIEQINIAVAEMDKVVQRNAATAEESAAAAEEMNAQAESMKEYVDEITSLVGGAGSNNGSARIRSGRTTVTNSHSSRQGTQNRDLMVRSSKTPAARNIIPMDDDFDEF